MSTVSSARSQVRARVKHRYTLGSGALDVYLEPWTGLAVLQVEFADERAAQEYQPPGFATREITAESALTGMSVARRADA